MNGIVFFDYDGTLVDESSKIFRPTKTTLETVKRLQANDIAVILATGRAKCYVPETGIEWDGIVASNGAYAEIGGETVYSTLVDKARTEELISRADELGYVYVLETQERCITNGMKNDMFLKMLNRFDISGKNFVSIDDVDEPAANKMFLVYDSAEKMELIQKAFEGKFVLRSHRGSFSCDCDTPDNNKGIGVRRIIEFTGIDRNKTYSFGDGPNDRELISEAGHGIAMGVHDKALSDVCESVTLTVAEEGVTAALKKFGLV